MLEIALFVAALFAAQPGSGGYPFTGYYAMVPGDLGADDAQLVCAFAFFRQHANGDFDNLLINMPAFDKDGTVRFDIEGGGACTITGTLEECTTEWTLDPGDAASSFVSVLADIDDAGVRVRGFDRIEDARSFILTGAPEPDYEDRYARCLGYDEASLAPFLSGERSDATPAESDALNASPTDATRPAMTAIRAKVLGNP